ncbi:MAG: 4Fe-4S binding protein [Desulfuromonadaceae bacterium]|nr:4Fe-4S binding protein [Desulfuromonadaceae bacterium]MDD5106561.1 4Fe-4S binding protein [Desulfuromonadaceae bacterium]
MPPVLPLQSQADKTRVCLETDGFGTLKTDFRDIPKIDSARCSGCGRCVAACPLRLITLEVAKYRKSAMLINAERCTHCGQCVESCLLDAII